MRSYWRLSPSSKESLPGIHTEGLTPSVREEGPAASPPDFGAYEKRRVSKERWLVVRESLRFFGCCKLCIYFIFTFAEGGLEAFFLRTIFNYKVGSDL